jgi:hypothetical protein
LLALLLLTACHATPASAPELVSARTFFERCAGAGWNFTYESALASTLEGLRVPVLDTAVLDAVELERHLDRALTESGLDARPVGPPELKTMLISRAG